MRIFHGISASPGISIGKALLLLEDNHPIPQYEISKDMIGYESDRFASAVGLAIQEIEELKNETIRKLQPDELNMLDTHLLMLADPELGNKIKNGLENTLQNTEYVLFSIMQEMIEKLGASTNQYLRERTADLHDVSKRILSHLMQKDRPNIKKLSEEVILVCHDLLPSDAISMDKLKVQGIAMDAGGPTSHTAILARAFEIPAVLGLSEITQHVADGDRVIVDGRSGSVIIKPDKVTLKKYLGIQRDLQKEEVQLLRFNELPAESKDGKIITLKANIEIPEEVEAATGHGADGVGLYRSEFLFISPGKLPNEEEQFQAYKHVLSAMAPKPVTIRTLDLGGDKLLTSGIGSATNEKNPILGWRAIRFCLSHRDLFRTQLRALIRASAFGNLRIMFPLISGVMELDQALEFYEEIREEIRQEGLDFDRHIPVGIMIEVPSAALVSDILAKKADFFSIGTNDLIQYTTAVDRGNEYVAYLYEPFHHGVLRLIQMTVENAHHQGIPVGMCGEMAGDPMNTLVLMGLGLDEFSMSSFGIPRVKQIVRSTSVVEAEELVGRILEIEQVDEVKEYVKNVMKERFSFNE